MGIKRSVMIGIAAVLTALSVSACGGGPPDDAAAEDFCEVWTTELAGGDSDSPDEQVDAAHDSAADLEDVGTPEDLGEGARNGFEVFIEFLGNIDTDDLEAMEQAGSEESFQEVMGIDADDAADVITFFEHANALCSDDQTTE